MRAAVAKPTKDEEAVISPVECGQVVAVVAPTDLKSPELKSPELKSPEVLQQAFHAFNQISARLTSSYGALEERIEQLTEEVDQANRQKLQELTKKESIAKRLQSLLALLPGGVVVLDKKGLVSECNPAAIDFLGEPLLGQPWRDVIRNSFAPRNDDGHEISLKDGRRISLATRSLGNEPGQVILLTDQTETRKLQQRLSRHQRLSAMGKMVSSLAHQIRTPLSAAMLYAGHLCHSELSAKQAKKFAFKLVSRLHHLEKQVKDMLIFAKGDAVLDDQISIRQLFAELKSATEEVFKSSEATCDWLNQAAEMNILCNKEALLGALMNLVNNALQSEGKRAKLKIKAQLESRLENPAEKKNSRKSASKKPRGKQLQQIRITVQDNGPGFDEEAQKLEPFYTTKAQGSGLGLAVAQVVAKAHKGEFWIESGNTGKAKDTDTKGARAGFILPCFKPTPSSK